MGQCIQLLLDPKSLDRSTEPEDLAILHLADISSFLLPVGGEEMCIFTWRREINLEMSELKLSEPRRTVASEPRVTSISISQGLRQCPPGTSTSQWVLAKALNQQNNDHQSTA